MSSLSLGIVGLPNVGKSTLFNALTKNSVLAANYPFATIEPNVGVVNVPDKRVEKLSEISGSTKIIPAACTFVDIAGIVRGASKGEGLGNKFLSHIRECNAIVQVVRAFENDDIVHVEGKIDPGADIETIKTELCLADIESIEKRIATLSKQAKADPKSGAAVIKLEQLKSVLDNNQLLSSHFDELPAEVHDMQLLTAKPFIYVFNIDESELGDETKKATLQELVNGSPAIFLSAQTEADLQDLPTADANELLQSLGQKESGLDTLIQLGYKTLGLETFLTSGPIETRGWTMRQGSTAPQAAGIIHTDFEKSFIKAEVVGYEDFVAGNGWAGAGSAGKVRLEGKDYIMQDGDIVIFRHGN